VICVTNCIEGCGANCTKNNDLFLLIVIFGQKYYPKSGYAKKIKNGKIMILTLVSCLSGFAVGVFQATLFYRDHKRLIGTSEKKRSLNIKKMGMFFMRYITLFALFILMFVHWKLPFFIGIVSFFCGFWITLIMKLKEHNES